MFFFTNDTALLLIDGGDTSDPQPPYDQDFRDLSFGTGSTIVVLSSVPTWVNHRRYNRDADILPDKPTEVVYVKYTGNPGLNTVRACLHLVENRPTQTRIRVVHGYKIDGLLYRETIDLSQPTGYTVTCDGEPENVFIEISVPSN